MSQRSVWKGCGGRMLVVGGQGGGRRIRGTDLRAGDVGGVGDGAVAGHGVFEDGLDVDWKGGWGLVWVGGEAGEEKRTDHAAVKVLHAAGLGDVAGDAQVEEDVVDVGVPVGL